MRKRCVLKAVLCVAALGACAGTPGTGRAARADQPTQAGGAATGSFALEIVANGTGRDVLLSANGVYDHERRRYTLDIGGTILASATIPRRTIAVEGVLYLDFPALARGLGAPTRWVSVRVGDEDVLGLRALDPIHLLDRLPSSGTTVESGDDGLVRRISTRFDAPGDDDDVVLTVAYADLGAPVTIEPPPADQVTDETQAVDGRSAEPTGG